MCAINDQGPGLGADEMAIQPDDIAEPQQQPADPDEGYEMPDRPSSQPGAEGREEQATTESEGLDGMD